MHSIRSILVVMTPNRPEDYALDRARQIAKVQEPPAPASV